MRAEVPAGAWKSCRQAQALAMVPGSSATVLDVFAATEGMPVNTIAGMLTKDPPPAAAFIAPASSPAAKRITNASMPPG